MLARIVRGRCRCQLQRRWVLALACLIWMFTPETGTAQNPALPGLTLDWAAPVDCPDRGEVLSRIANHLHLSKPSSLLTHVDARVLRVGSHYQLELRLRIEDGEPAVRALQAGTCAALADATAVLVALALDPQPTAAGTPKPELDSRPPSSPAQQKPADSPASGPTEAPEAQEPAIAAPAPPTREATPAPVGERTPGPVQNPAPTRTEGRANAPIAPAADGGEPSSAALRLAIAAGLRFDSGMLPESPKFAGQARVELRFLRLRAAAGISLFPKTGSRADEYPNARLDAHAILGDGVLGIAIADGPVSFGPRALLECASLTVATSEIAARAQRSVLWAAAGLGAYASYHWTTGFELGVEAAGVLPFSRPRWWVSTTSGPVTLFEARVITMRASVGLAYVFE